MRDPWAEKWRGPSVHPFDLNPSLKDDRNTKTRKQKKNNLWVVFQCAQGKVRVDVKGSNYNCTGIPASPAEGQRHFRCLVGVQSSCLGVLLFCCKNNQVLCKVVLVLRR